MREELVRRVTSAAAKLDYRPNVAARSLRLARTMTFGVVFTRFDGPIATEVLHGLDEAAGARDYTMLVGVAHGDSSIAGRLMRRLFERRVDGLFVYRPTDIAEAHVAYAEAGIPVLGLYAKGRGAESIPLVTHQPSVASREAVRRLHQLGHRAYAYVATPVEMDDSRAVALQAAADALDLEYVAHPLPDQSDDASIRAALHAVRVGSPCATAIFIRHRHLPALLRAVRDAEMRIPDDLSVISFGDSEWLTAVGPPVATVSTSGSDLGHVAVETMFRWIDDEMPPEPVTHASPSIWIERASVGPAPVSD